jgi:hypothetical protein
MGSHLGMYLKVILEVCMINILQYMPEQNLSVRCSDFGRRLKGMILQSLQCKCGNPAHVCYICMYDFYCPRGQLPTNVKGYLRDKLHIFVS